MPTLGNLEGKLPQELIDERRPFFGVSIDPADLLPKRGLYLQRFNAHIAWLADLLGDGRRFILGANPSAADLSAYHPIWFARQNGGPEIMELLSFSKSSAPGTTASRRSATASPSRRRQSRRSRRLFRQPQRYGRLVGRSARTSGFGGATGSA